MKKMIALLALMTATISLATVHTVNVNALSFSPANLTIQQGDTVRWVKPAGGFHNVEESNNIPPIFRSGEPTSSAFTYNFAFAAPLSGTYNYECVVHAGSGMVGTVTVQGGGSAPGAPSNPTPANGSTGILPSAGVGWNAAENADHYTVRFGTSNPPPIVAENVQTTAYFPPANMQPGTQHFWQITAINQFGSTDGPVWSFTTLALPAQVDGAFPANNATNVPVSTILGWDESNGATSYEVFLGTSQPLPSLGEITGTTIDPPGNLIASTAYLWRVDAINDAGRTTGIVWSFTTEAGSAVGDPVIAAAFQLGQAYPNPFNSNVRVMLNVAQESQTTVRVFDLLGQEIATLVNSRLSAGEHQLEWNASGQSAGLYFLKCECAGLSQTQKLIYLP